MNIETHDKAMTPAMGLALAANFGSVDRWRAEFVAMAEALGCGPGWTGLFFMPLQGSLVNLAAAGHAGPPAGAVLMLELDMSRIAGRLGQGAAVRAAIDAFMADIDWGAVYARYQVAVHAASEPFSASPDDVAGAVLLDVRRAGVFDTATTMLPGAQWRDPAIVAEWATEISPEREVVVYCVYGHEVGRATALRLRAAGLKARFLGGGFDEWQKAGRLVTAKAVA